MIVLLLLGVLILLIVLGMPIAFAILGSALTGILVGGFSNLTTVPTAMYGGVASISLMAIPMFALMGEIMAETKLSDKLIDIANALVGWIKGGLGMATVVTCMLFGTVSGSAVAGAAALGPVLIPQMERKGYPKAMGASLLSSAATLAIIVPPSSALITYAVIAGCSITDLFKAAIIPGVLSGVALMVVTGVMARKYNLPREESFSFKNLAVSIKNGFGALLIPIVIFGGIFGGVFTATEAAGVSVLVAAIAGCRKLKLKAIPGMLIRTAKSTAIVTFMIGASMVLSAVFTFAKVPQTITGFILGFTSNKVVILLLLNLLLLFLGCILHGSAATLLVTPLALPLVESLGMSPIHFGIMLTLNVGIGQQTPPVASVLITVSSLTGISIEKLWKYLKFFLIAALVSLLLVTYIPALSMCLV